MANRKRTKQLVIRLSDDEFQAVKEKVEQAGVNQQEFIIRALMDKPVMNSDGIKQLLPEMKRIGNNLNQIAKRMNTGFNVSADAVASNQKELSELWQQLRQYLRTQG